jgi:hypothetical protein
MRSSVRCGVTHSPTPRDAFAHEDLIMKTGMTLQQLATEIERRAASKKDFIAPAGKMSVAVVDNQPKLALQNGELAHFGLNAIAHGQLAEYAGIPMAYYKRMQAADPELLAHNVNRWLSEKPAERRMVRTLDGDVRAVLSDKFRALDNEDLAEAILPVLLDMDLLILSCDITERKLYIKAVDKSIERQCPTGARMGDGGHTIFDCLAPAIIVSNSEVGCGALSIESGIWTKACTNLASFGANMRKYHTGARSAISDEVFALLTDQTKRLTDAAVWAQTRDLVKGAFDVARFEATIGKLNDAAQQKLPDDPVQVIERVGKKFGLAEGERKGILSRLIEGADLTRYGVHSAITRHSSDVENYDRATELERLGGQVIELSANDWQEVVRIAA